MTIPGLLAGIFRVNEENSLRALIPAGSTVFQVVIYFGALLVVALGVFAWAVVFRRRRHRRHSYHRQSRSATRRQQKPETRPHTRTLAQAGGLPPVRTE